MVYMYDREVYLKKTREMCKLRGFSPRTIKSYLYHINDFFDFILKCRQNKTKLQIVVLFTLR